MSRPLRIEYPDAWYHVMNRGRRGDAVFSCRADYEMFLALLQDAAELWEVRVAAYCLMENHYHILLQTPLGNLSRFMRHLNGVYTQRYNKIHGYDGQLFRGRFKSILVGDDSYLLEVMRYIHRNPLKAGLVQRLDDYKWVSHQNYLDSTGAEDWVCKNTILNMLSKDIRSIKAYLKFMYSDDSNEVADILDAEKWPAVFGGERFTSWVKGSFFEKKKHREVPDSVNLSPGFQQILHAVSIHYNVDEKTLLVGRRGRKNEPRDVALYLCRVLRKDTLIELGGKFGMPGYGPAGSVVSRVERKIAENLDICKQLEEIKAKLYSGLVSDK